LPDFADGGQQTEATKLCDMLQSEPDLQMHVKIRRVQPLPKTGDKKCLFCDGSHLNKTLPHD